MKTLLLLPFRIVAFFIRMLFWIVAIPLIIVIRILEIVAPELMGPLRRGIVATINIFKF